MSDIPPVTEADLQVWYKMQDELRKLKFAESQLRKRLVTHYFGAEAAEGTNTFELAGGFKLKGIIVVNRDVEEGVMQANAERYKQLAIPLNKLVKYKPDLVKSEYNKLLPDQKKAFDECLVIKEGSPQLRIDPPSNKGN